VLRTASNYCFIERSNSGLNSGAGGWIGPTENDVANSFGATTAADFPAITQDRYLDLWRKEIIKPPKEQTGKRSGDERIESSEDNS
jgi:hypothetical protein